MLLKSLLSVGLAVFGAIGCQPAVVKKVMTSQIADYLRLPDDGKPVFDVAQVSPHVYSFSTNFDRGIFIVSEAGIIVVDPFNKAVATALKEHLDKSFPGKPVAALVYSHYHLDHVRGGSVLGARDVIAHAGCEGYWRDLDAQDVAPVTKPIQGDVTLAFGDVDVRLIALPKGHTDTNYAVYVPGDKLLFAADMAFVKAFPPYGMPDTYRPGQIAGLKQLATLDFDAFVPSHFGVGKKQDLLDNVTFYEDSVAAARDAVRASDGFPPPTREAFKKAFDAAYDKMEAKYKSWYGFDAQGLQLVLRDVIGQGLGIDGRRRPRPPLTAEPNSRIPVG